MGIGFEAVGYRKDEGLMGGGRVMRSKGMLRSMSIHYA